MSVEWGHQNCAVWKKEENTLTYICCIGARGGVFRFYNFRLHRHYENGHRKISVAINMNW